MIALRLVATAVLAAAFVWLAAINWRVWFLRTYRKRPTSWVPLIGGVCGVVGFVIEPSETLRRVWWLPLVLDYGAVPGLLQTVLFYARRSWSTSRGHAHKDRLLADGETVWLEPMQPSEFSELLDARLPEMSQIVTDHAGLIYVQVAAIGEELMRHVRAGQVEYPLRILTFLEDVLTSDKVPRELENALEVSFITTTDLCETAAGRRVAELAPERVRSIISRTA